MTRRNRPRSRDPRDRRQPGPFEEWIPRNAIAAGLGTTILAVFVYYGGPNHLGKVLAHFGILLCLIGALFAPDYWLEKKALIRRIALVGVVVLAGQATGLIPLPAFLGRLVNPSWEFDRFGASWDFSTLSVTGTLDALTSTSLVVGTAMVVSVAVLRRRRLLTVIRFATVFVVAYAVVMMNLRLPLYSNSTTPPFIDANHFGAALALGFPAVVFAARTSRTEIAERFGWGAFAVAIMGLVLWKGSIGPVVACTLVAVPVIFRTAVPRLVAFIVLGGVLGLGGFLIPQRGGVTHGRLEIWLDTFRGFWDHWLLGAGSGAYGTLIEPYRNDIEMHVWTHAHNDWIEWAAEGGLVGIGVIALAVWLLARAGSPRTMLPEESKILGLCVVALLIQAAFEFPMHLPFLTLCLTALWTWWRTTFFEHGAISARAVRVFLGGALVLNMLSLGFHVHGAAVDGFVEDLRGSGPVRERAESMLGRIAPWSGEYLILQANNALRAGRLNDALATIETVVRIHPRDSRILRPAAGIALLAGDPERAVVLAQRVRDLAPALEPNWRTWANITSRVHPERAHEVWLATLRRGFGVHKEAYAAFPEGLVWAADLSGLSPSSQIKMAKAIGRDDPVASAFAFEALRFSHPNVYPLEYTDVLMKTDQLGKALDYWESMPLEVQVTVDAQQLRAQLAERLGDTRTASVAWGKVWKLNGDRKARIRMGELLAASVEPQVLVEAMLRMRAENGDLTVPEVVLLADAYRRLGEGAKCAAELAGSDFVRAPKPIRRQAFRLQSVCDRPDASTAAGVVEE